MFPLSHQVLALHQASINSKLVVVSAVLISMMLAEQYLPGAQSAFLSHDTALWQAL